jgi:hypothetical protein
VTQGGAQEMLNCELLNCSTKKKKKKEKERKKRAIGRDV